MPILEGEPSLTGSNDDVPGAVWRKNGECSCALLLERCRMFAGLLPDAYAEICRAANSRQFTRGEILHFEGDAVESVVLLASGLVKITKLGQGSGDAILRLAGHGDVLGAESLFSSGRHFTTAEVFRACRAFVWDARVFKNLAERYPILQRNMVGILDERLRELEDRFREVATKRVGPRVALQLLRLLKSIGQPGKAGVEVCLSREELAQMTGTTLFTVSRLLCDWEAHGVVRPRREVVAVCDVESLRALSEGISPAQRAGSQGVASWPCRALGGRREEKCAVACSSLPFRRRRGRLVD